MIDAEVWIDVHRKAHQLGIKSTATMMYGTLESDEDIVEHLDMVRRLQDETGGFRAFIMWSFQGQNTELLRLFPDMQKPSSNRYLRLLAVARLFLDNVPNIQSSWVTQGPYIGQMALLYGANDLGSTMMEENVVSSAGAAYSMAKDELARLISDIDEKPAIRNTAYEILEMLE
jgi:cyclic dehypoxanthinyl futalosine synthase